MASADAPRQHPDPDDLALLALDPGDASLSAARAHVASCADCAREMAELTAVVSTARAAVVSDFGDLGGADGDGPARRTLPGPGVWDAIAAATGVRSAPDPDLLRRSLQVPEGSASPAGRPSLPLLTSSPAPLLAVPTRGLAPAAASAVPGGSSDRSRRRWSTGALVGAAAAALVLGAAGGIAVGAVARDGGGDGGRQVESPAPVVAAAQLDPLTPAQQSAVGAGTAEVVRSGSTEGGNRLVVDTRGLPGVEGAVHEVWLLDPTTGGLFAVGFLVDGRSPAGGYALPEGIDLSRYSAVDVSAEPLDGDELHSGNSELRGQLRPATT